MIPRAVEYALPFSTFEDACVPPASASAVAFSMGLFSERGSFGAGKHRAFAVSTESRASDLLLRFFDTCQSYKVLKSWLFLAINFSSKNTGQVKMLQILLVPDLVLNIPFFRRKHHC